VTAKTFVNEICAQPSVEALQSFLKSHRDRDQLRTTLFNALDKVREYENANEWATAVCICEALTIVGWAKRERVDAISRFNGDCWETYFINSFGEHRFREGRWTKRKAGWVLFNPKYHASPDFPNIPSKSWKLFAGVDFAAVNSPKLLSQRNYQKQMPIIMGLIGGSNATSDCASKLKRELDHFLRRSMEPEMYGDALECFYFTLLCPYLDTTYTPHLKIGAYRPLQRSFYCDLFFGEDFGDRDRNDQKAFFIENLASAINALEFKFRKKRINFDITRFQSHVESACEAWMRADRISFDDGQPTE